MDIREAREDDVHQLANLVGSLAHFYLEGGKRSLPPWFMETIQPAAFITRIASKDYLNLVHQTGNLIDGYICIKNGSHLFHLFVPERAQGKGIARKLWSRAKAANPSVHHYSLRSSMYAVPVYLKLGFHKIGEPGYKSGIWFQPMEFTTP